jgi:hypothetical protein
MTGELLFEKEAAVEYDCAFAHVTRYFMPFLGQAQQLAKSAGPVSPRCLRNPLDEGHEPRLAPSRAPSYGSSPASSL